jgi:hypothetical protein
MRHRLAIASAAVVALAAPSALAEPSGAEPVKEGVAEGRLPVAEAERPITLPRFVLNPELDFDVPHLGANFVNLSLGASFGITDDFTVRAQVLPLQLAGPAGSGFHYGQATGLVGIDNPGPGIGATYRFVRGFVEVGGSLDANIITVQSVTGVVITPGIPVRIHATKQLRIDTGAYLPITRSTDGVLAANSVGLSIPASVLYDITEPIHVGLGTGFQIVDFSQPGGTVAIPLGIFAGYAIAGKDGPIVDIDPFFTFPALFTPGTTGPNAKQTDTGDYVVGLSVGGFFYL